MTDEERVIRNLRAVENAIAQQNLEGLEVPRDVVEQMLRAAREEISLEEGLRGTLKKYSHDEI